MENPPRVPSGPSKAWVILAIIIVIVGSLSVPLIMINLEVEVTGQVVDSNGYPIPGASVISGRGSTRTNDEGIYSLKVFDFGQVIIRAEADGHWTQKKEMKTEENGARIVDFTLIEDVICHMPIGAIFLDLKENTNLNGTLTVLTNALNSERWVQVGDFAPGGKQDFRIEFSGSISSMDVWFYQHYNASSFIEMATGTISGVYWDTPGECENCYVRSWMGEGNDHISLNVQDYLSSNAAQDEHTFNSDNRGGEVFTNSPQESYQLNDVFSVKVSVSILGKQFNCTLPVLFGPATEGAAYIQVVLFSMNDDPTAVKTLVEGGHILHIWEVDE